MATRYIGDAVVKITYDDRTDAYKGTVSAGGYTWRFDGLHNPPAGIFTKNRQRVGVDHPLAYDAAAASAVSFGSYFSSHNRGDDVPDWAPPPHVADAIEEAVGWAQDDRGTYEVRRKR